MGVLTSVKAISTIRSAFFCELRYLKQLSNLTTKQLSDLSNSPTKLMTPLLSSLYDGWCGGMRGAVGIMAMIIMVLYCCSEIAFSDRCAKLRSLFFEFLYQAQFCSRDAINKKGA